jgi:uncharacterized ferritin-like protein (DUF455 family)
LSALPPTSRLRERVDTAQALTCFHYLARAVAVACGGWIAATPRLEAKAALARGAWQHALAGDAFRERVFELRYPTRFLEEGADAPLIRSFESVIHAPDSDAFLSGLVEAIVPDLADRYRDFLGKTDELADGPTVRIVASALQDVEEQAGALFHRQGPGPMPWVSQLRHGIDTLERPAGTPFRLAEQPARDDRYAQHSFYWPDTIVPDYPYGEGVALQVRAAVSHLNEVWAVDTAGAILHGLAPELGWEWIRDAARWTYDEARHMLMGKRRLDAWGLPPQATPLGGYIYEAAAGQDLLYRLGMLAYFETKNIGRKKTRAAAFGALGDTTSETDMEYDWADETLHAEYGRRWLRRLLEERGEDPESWPQVLERCETLVSKRLAEATDDDRERIVRCAEELLALAAATVKTD